jgi:hypothetical protein
VISAYRAGAIGVMRAFMGFDLHRRGGLAIVLRGVMARFDARLSALIAAAEREGVPGS